MRENTMFEFSSKSKGRMQGVHPELVMVFLEAIKYSPIDFGIPADGGVRTAARQKEMYLNPDIVTNCDGYMTISNHQLRPNEEFGRAIDVFAYINHMASWKPEHLAMIGGHILATANRMRHDGEINIGVKWGGEFGSPDFTGWDYPHFECFDIN